MPTLYRLTKTARAREAFTGEGARLYGGRWNSPGLRAVYTSGSRALALLETLVHLDTSAHVPAFAFVSVELDAGDIEQVTPAAVARLNQTALTRPHGDLWLRQNRHLALAVPSVVVPQEFNYILNPAHPRFLALRPSAPAEFIFDQRLYLDTESSSVAAARKKRVE